ncbi:hypothetical protein BGT96224_A21215, partial [Blumeria graminis f. sp. tritici 96224]
MYKLSNLFRDTEMAIKKNLIKFDRFNQLIEDILVEDDFCHILESTIRFSESACHDVSLLQSGEQTPAVSNTYTNNFQRNTSEVSDFNETADTLAEAMQSELQENVFSGISNFWSVFFEGKAWSKQTSCIWECYKTYEKAEECNRTISDQDILTLKEEMTETQVCDWLDFFRDKFLNQLNGPIAKPLNNCRLLLKQNSSQLRGQYCTTKLMKNTISTTPNAQVDFLIQSMELSDDEPQWKDVKVVAEFSKKTHKNARKAKFLKLSGY